MQKVRPGKTSRVAKHLSALTEQVAAWLDHSHDSSAQRQFIKRAMSRLAAATQRKSESATDTEVVAQLFVHTRWAWAVADRALHRAAGIRDILPPDSTLLGDTLRWVIDGPSASWKNAADVDALSQVYAAIDGLAADHVSTRGNGKGAGDYDVWLSYHDRRQRAAWGVYYTPRPIAAHIVREVDRALRCEFDLPDGLADTRSWMEVGRPVGDGDESVDFARDPFIRILDPALGDGVFLVEVIQLIYETLTHKWNDLGMETAACNSAWNEYVSQFLLPRMTGLEILLAPAAIAWIHIAEKLAETGYRFERPCAINVVVADTLAVPTTTIPPYTVIVGNPPFSALATNESEWIGSIMRSSELNGRKVSSYFEVDGKPLGERKLWVHDDYVKFLRYAQWRIEQAGCGVVGFVTNHGYLDNLTFRGVRASLLNSFPRMSILDLHGNRKKHESTTTGSRDENVFGIEQGVAIGIFRKPLQTCDPHVHYGDLWGNREGKYASLAHADARPALYPITPLPPYYFLVPTQETQGREEEYGRGFLLNDIMPVHSTAAVTARDSFVIAMSKQELLDRWEAFRNPNQSDDEIRKRFFQATRSHRYPRGDTRGWKLAAARQTARQLGDLEPYVRVCQYRPFDYRYALWTDCLVDWPRPSVMHHMLAGDNLALVARRQMLPNRACNFFWITSTLVVDGLIRSDNRGSESFFPLYLRSGNSDDNDSSKAARTVNLAPEFLKQCGHRCKLSPTVDGRGDLGSTIGAEDILAMVYAQFFSTVYRQRYAEFLRLGFPRVFLPRSRELLFDLCRLGHELIQCHLLRNAAAAIPDVIEKVVEGNSAVSNGFALTVKGMFPVHDGESVVLSDSYRVSRIDGDTWEYRIGAHQVCHKWLRDRAGRVLTADELLHFRRIVAAVHQTIQLVSAIDRSIDQYGGWPDGFTGIEE